MCLKLSSLFVTTSTVMATVPDVAKTPLPCLELAKFKGDFTGWITLWDAFKVGVHDNIDIS